LCGCESKTICLAIKKQIKLAMSLNYNTVPEQYDKKVSLCTAHLQRIAS